jgi:uncharacterized iron-regulated membrane protein
MLEEMAKPAAAQSASDSETHPSSRARLYRLLWRWHFYAGVFTAPVLLIAAVTGALYIFIDELKPWMYPELMVAESTSTASRLSLDEVAAAVRRELPDVKIQAVTEPSALGRNAEVGVRLSDGNRTAFVDPSTGRIAGLYDEHAGFFGIVLNLHRRLFLGSFGRSLVELTASWGLILLITGCYLWWPRGKGRAEARGYGVWRPRLRGSLRTVLRDWHAVVGIYGLTTAAFVLATGLFFTQWFSPSYNWVSTQVSPPAPATPKSSAPAGREQISLAAVVVAAEPTLPGDGPVRVILPTGPTDTFKVSRRTNASPTLRSTVHVDAYTGEVVGAQGWDSASPMQKVRMTAYPIHVGSIFGLPTKVLALLTCLALILLAITGVWMWWRRRPRGTWGLPPDSAVGVPAWLGAVILLLGILLPAVGGSLIVILAAEFAWSRLRRRHQPTAA